MFISVVIDAKRETLTVSAPPGSAKISRLDEYMVHFVG